MIPPQQPDDEACRLETLRALDILDTPPEERFNRVTRLARRLFDVPIALVSLIDENRQWFKSRDGLAACETPRDISFCGHAILGSDLLIIPDALADVRFADNPLVVGEPKIRFYAGCPLTMPNGTSIGTLCIIDRVPRAFDTHDQALLRDLAGMVVHELAALHLATVDELTQISNRRGFERLAAHTLDLCRRMHKIAYLVYLDLDGFKRINDTFGHLEGDLILREFGHALVTTFRCSDVIGRIGGDEFAVLVADIALPGVEAAIARLEEELASRRQSNADGGRISFSAGIVAFDPDGDQDLAGLMTAADAFMYQQKRQGKRAAPAKHHVGG